MDIYQAIFLGAVQGLTEFLPVSSSGHLVLFQNLFGLKEPQLFFDISLHVGTLLAVVLIYLKEMKHLIVATFGLLSSLFRKGQFLDRIADDPDSRMVWLIIIGTLPTGVIGMILKQFTDTLFSSVTLVGGMLIVTGVILWATRNLRETAQTIGKVSLKKGFLIGVVQGIAVIPGISRSGSTIAAGLFMGVEKETAARYSFLLSIPAIFGAELVELMHMTTTDISLNIATVAGVATAFFFGYGALTMLLKIVQQRRLHLFAYYCWAVGLLAMGTGLLQPC